MKFACLLIFLAGPSWAACGPTQQTFLTCQLEKSSKTLSVCYDDKIANYSYGPVAGPAELTLQEPIATLAYTPWPGVGNAIWEEVTFHNGDYSYTVVAGIERNIPDLADDVVGEGLFGGVLVQRGEVAVADLSCDPFQVDYDYLDGLSEAKSQLGFAWNVADRTWVELPD